MQVRYSTWIFVVIEKRFETQQIVQPKPKYNQNYGKTSEEKTPPVEFP